MFLGIPWYVWGMGALILTLLIFGAFYIFGDDDDDYDPNARAGPIN